SRRDADEWLGEVLVGEADALQHRARGRAVDAVRQQAATALRGIGRAVVHAHAEAPRSAILSGSTCASGKRCPSAAAVAGAAALSAQTTTVGPEPESVTPCCPGAGSSR